MKKAYSLDSLTELHQNEEAFWLEEMSSNATLMSPSKQSIQNILGYSKALNCQKSKSIGMIEHLLN